MITGALPSTIYGYNQVNRIALPCGVWEVDIKSTTPPTRHGLLPRRTHMHMHTCTCLRTHICAPQRALSVAQQPAIHVHSNQMYRYDRMRRNRNTHTRMRAYRHTQTSDAGLRLPLCPRPRGSRSGTPTPSGFEIDEY